MGDSIELLLTCDFAPALEGANVSTAYALADLIRERYGEASISHSMVGKAVSGQRTPSLPMALMIAKVCNVTVDDIWRLKD